MYDTVARRVYIVSLADCQPCRSEQLTFMASILDSRSYEVYQEAMNKTDGRADETLLQSYRTSAVFETRKADPSLPLSLKQATGSK